MTPEHVQGNLIVAGTFRTEVLGPGKRCHVCEQTPDVIGFHLPTGSWTVFVTSEREATPGERDVAIRKFDADDLREVIENLNSVGMASPPETWLDVDLKIKPSVQVSAMRAFLLEHDWC
jgi:hypothetical protein